MGQQMGGADFDAKNLIPGNSPSYLAPFGRFIMTNDWSMPLNSAFASASDWLHGVVSSKVSDTIPYRATEVSLQGGLAVAGAIYFHRPGLYGDAATYALDPKLSSQPGPGNLMQQRLPMDTARLARVSGNADADEAAGYAANLWTTQGKYHESLGLLANRFAEATHTKGASLLTTALSADTLYAMWSVGKYVVDGKTDTRPPLMLDSPVKLSFPSFDYYNTNEGPYVQARVFVNPRATMVPVVTAGATLGQPGGRVGAALWRIPVINNRLYVTPDAAIDVLPSGVGFSAGLGADVRILGNFGLTAAFNYSRNDVLHQDVGNRSDGFSVTVGPRIGF